jgi:hypothetical protein
LSIPAGIDCKRKRANEAFIFLALYVARMPATFCQLVKTNVVAVSSLSLACSLKSLASGLIARKTARTTPMIKPILGIVHLLMHQRPLLELSNQY